MDKKKTAVGEKYAIDEKSAVQDDTEGAVDTECGFGSWKPACLQKCHNTKIALLILSLFAIIQGKVFNIIGLVPAVQNLDHVYFEVPSVNMCHSTNYCVPHLNNRRMTKMMTSVAVNYTILHSLLNWQKWWFSDRPTTVTNSIRIYL
jgi:hypothetical protein